MPADFQPIPSEDMRKQTKKYSSWYAVLLFWLRKWQKTFYEVIGMIQC